MAFDPDAFIGASAITAPTPQSSSGFNPDAFIQSPISEGNLSSDFNPDAFIDPEKSAYIDKQQQLQNQPLLSKAGDFIHDVPYGLIHGAKSIIGGAVPFAKTALTGLEPLGQSGTNARQNILNAGLVNASDAAEAYDINAPRFVNMFTGNKFTPEQLGQQYDQEKAYQNERGVIQNLGANPSISKQLDQQGVIGSILGRISAPGTAQVNPELQNQIAPFVDPTMYIPFAEAEGGIKTGLQALGMNAAKDATSGLTASLAGKALGATGRGMQAVSGWKDAAANALKTGVETVTGDPNLANAAGHYGVEAGIGLASHAMGMGHGGAALGIAAPRVLKAGGDALATAGKVLQEGEGTVPFFERMAQEAKAQNNNLAAQAYGMLDSSGAGALLTKAATIGKDAVKATVLTAPYQLPLAGNDPEQAANMIGANLGFAIGGGLLHSFKPISDGEMAAKQAFDVAAVRKQYPAFDNLVESQAKIAADQITQTNPKIDPNKAQAAGALYASRVAGDVASIVRSNPDVIWHFEPGLVGGEGHRQWVDTDGKSNIALNVDSPSLVSQVIAHELIHHISSAENQGEILGRLLGDPDTKTPGILRSYNPDGTVKDNPVWVKFRQIYTKALGATDSEMQIGGSKAMYDRKMAEEFFAEAMGSVLAGRTKNGELNYNRIRRSGMSDAILEKVFGVNSSMKLNPIDMGFIGDEKLNPLQWINQNKEMKNLVFDYLKNKEYLRHGKDMEYKSDFNTPEQHSVEWIKRNPKEAEKLYGNDLSLNFQPKKNGEIGFDKVLSKKQEEAKAQEQANVLLEKLKQDPSRVTQVTRADGKTEYRIKNLDDQFLSSLRQLNNFHRNNLIKLSESVNGAPGTVWKFTYQPASKGSKHYASRERGVYEAIPYDLVISQPEGGKKGSNILTHILDLNQMLKNREQIIKMMQKTGLPLDPRYSDNEWFRDSLSKMAQAHQEGKKSTDGTGISDAQKDFLNAAMGVTPKEANEPSEGYNILLDTLKEKTGTAKIRSAVKSFRLDRINRMDAAEGWGNIPFQYPASKVNRRPSENPVPESANTLKTQQDEMISGKRSAMLFTNGEEQIPLPEGFKSVKTTAGVFQYDPKKFTVSQIKKAVKDEKIGDILDYGISKKPDINKPQIAIVRRDKNGNEIESILTDKENLKNVISKQQSRLEEGQIISTEEPEKVVGERQSLLKNQAPSTYLGEQKIPDQPSLHLYNLTQDIPGHSQGSTVSDKTLTDLGYDLPSRIKPQGNLMRPEEARQNPPETYNVPRGTIEKDQTGGPKIMAGGNSGVVEGQRPELGKNDSPAALRSSAPQQFLEDYISHHAEDLRTNGRNALEGPDALLVYAAKAGKLISSQEASQLKKYPIKGGIEHEVSVLPDEGRVIKITKDKTNWGLNGQDEIGYLTRLENMNKLAPGLDAKVEGIINNRGWPSIVVSMKQIEGTHPTQEELSQYMKDKGFEDEGGYWFKHKDTGLRIRDAAPRNFIKRSDGTMVPIDVIIDGNPSKPLFRPDENPAQGEEFHSNLQKIIEQKMPNKATADQIRGIIKGNGIKDEEVKWSGLEDYLKNNRVTTKQDLLNHLIDNSPKIQEHVLGNDSHKYAMHALPGGSNYREIVYSIPVKDGIHETESDYRKDQYSSSHYSEIPNSLAHMRIDDRKDASGKEGLFIEEMQSDRHQQGREKGYQEENNPEGIPDAPFRKTWHEFLFRKALNEAVKTNKDWIGWTTGDTQANRYDLSKHVANIQYHEATKVLTADNHEGEEVISQVGVTPENMADYIGKDAAKKIMEKESAFGFRTLFGVDMKVGGEGMSGFYDKMIPTYADKYLKRFGVKAEKSEILGERLKGSRNAPEARELAGLSQPEWDSLTPKQREDWKRKGNPFQIWKIDLTPKIKEFVKSGQPLFRPESKSKNPIFIPKKESKNDLKSKIPSPKIDKDRNNISSEDYDVNRDARIMAGMSA